MRPTRSFEDPMTVVPIPDDLLYDDDVDSAAVHLWAIIAAFSTDGVLDSMSQTDLGSLLGPPRSASTVARLIKQLVRNDWLAIDGQAIVRYEEFELAFQVNVYRLLGMPGRPTVHWPEDDRGMIRLATVDGRRVG